MKTKQQQIRSPQGLLGMDTGPTESFLFYLLLSIRKSSRLAMAH